MGLISEGDEVAILTDIMGDEDHFGDMDFKVAGTRTGITALQMDIKVDGLTKEIMGKALTQAKEARLHIHVDPTEQDAPYRLDAEDARFLMSLGISPTRHRARQSRRRTNGDDQSGR